ncbi:hypothetical protein ARUE_c19050 [Arthrobacter sp. Rue61a]|nr:hypothetical protein ARUE_c19050 [Arthrobacter sp. Rue61a]
MDFNRGRHFCNRQNVPNQMAGSGMSASGGVEVVPEPREATQQRRAFGPADNGAYIGR